MSDDIASEDKVTIEFPELTQDEARVISRWKSYTVTHKFLEPCATFHMTVGGEAVSDEVRGALRPGLRVILRINEAIQFSGYLDSFDISATRDGGTELTISGRDLMAPVVDACADYTRRITEKTQLSAAVALHLGGFGFTNIEFDNQANVEVIQGHFSGNHIKAPSTAAAPSPTRRRRKRMRHRGKRSGYVTSLLVPYPGEGTYEFLQRLLSREGLYMWARADQAGSGEGTAVLSAPDVFALAEYSLTLGRDGTGNVLQSSCSRDWKDQPTIIFCSGANRHEGYARGKHKVYIVNPFVAINPKDQTVNPAEEIQRLKEKHGNPRELVAIIQDSQEKYLTLSPVARPTFLVATEGQTPTQVEFMARRFLAEKMRKHFTYTAVVRGHTFNGIVWAVDSCVNVVDDYCDVDERLYILSKTFSKSRGGGTTTKLEMVRPESMEWLGGAAYGALSKEAYDEEKKELDALRKSIEQRREDARRQREADALQRDIVSNLPVNIDNLPGAREAEEAKAARRKAKK